MRLHLSNPKILQQSMGEGCELLGEEAAASLGRKLPVGVVVVLLSFAGLYAYSA